jgi:uncharacterized protein YcbK (DUF882 family)
MNRRRVLSMIAGTAMLPQVALAVPLLSRRLRLANPHTGETFAGTYRDENGVIPAAMADLAVFLRDFHSGERIAIDVGVLDFLAAVMEVTGIAEAAIYSAYRTRATNEMLARTTFGVAENSQHIYGRALDVHFGSKLVEAMRVARTMQRGGVGWYPHSGFMHIDTGPVRNWDLDESGLGPLLFKDRRVHFKGNAEAPRDAGRTLYLPGLERSGRLSPELQNSGRVLPGIENSGRLLPEMARGLGLKFSR